MFVQIKRWILHQVYSDMILKKNGSIREIDHCIPMSSFIILDRKEIKKIFSCNNLRLMYCIETNTKWQKLTTRYTWYKKLILLFFEKEFPKNFWLKTSTMKNIVILLRNKTKETNKIFKYHIDEISSLDLKNMSDSEVLKNIRFRYLFIIFDSASKYIRCI